MSLEMADIPGFPGYKINKLGLVKYPSGKIMIGGFASYPCVVLKRDGKDFSRGIHLLVAQVFVENPKPDVYNIVNHLNEIKYDPFYKNLEWTTQAGNIHHTRKLHRIKPASCYMYALEPGETTTLPHNNYAAVVAAIYNYGKKGMEMRIIRGDDESITVKRFA